MGMEDIGKRTKVIRIVWKYRKWTDSKKIEDKRNLNVKKKIIHDFTRKW